MKKNILLITALILSLSACQKQDFYSAFSRKQVSFRTAETETRTEFGDKEGKKYPVLWNQGDEITVLLASKNATSDSINVCPTVTSDRKGISFKCEFTTEAEQDAFCVLYPANSMKSISNVNKTWNLEVPAIQTPLTNGPDPTAQILWARSEFTEMPEVVDLTFQHVTAYGLLSFKNLALDGASVKFVSLSTEADIVGRYFLFISNATKDGVDYVTGDITGNVPGGSLTINTTATEGIWFSTIPADLSGKDLKIVISTDKGTFTRTISVPEGRKLEAGKVANIEVDMSGISLVPPVVYKKVTSASSLAAGDEIILIFPTTKAERESDYYAFTSSQKGNNRQAAPIDFDGESISDPAENVERLILEEGATSGTFYLHSQITEGYLYAAAQSASSQNYLRTGAATEASIENYDLRRSWALTFKDNGTVAIDSQLVTLQTKWAVELQFNDSNIANNPRVSCYKTSASNPLPYILRKEK